MNAIPRVLCVDDEPAILDGLRRNFRGHEARFEAYFASDPEQAITQARTLIPAVVVSDLAMPGLGGLAMIRRMQDFLPDSHYILLTGTADLAAAVDAINSAGIFRFYTKPCPPEPLLAAIDDALAERSLMRDPSPAGLAALSLLPTAVLVTDPDARLIFANRAGATTLAQADAIALSPDNVCRARTPRETAELHALVAGARRQSSSDQAGMLLSRRDRAGLRLGVAPLPGALGRIALFLSDPEDIQLPSPAMIARYLDLSPAEARLAHVLAEGLRLEDAALACGVTLATARTYLRQIFSKTGFSRQTELVRAVLTAPVHSR